MSESTAWGARHIPVRACSSGSADCTGRSPKRAGSRAAGRACRGSTETLVRHGMPGWIDPGRRAVRVYLLLPYWKALLDRFDHKAARRERLLAVRRRRREHDARLTGRNESQPELQGHTRFRPPHEGAGQDSLDLLERHQFVDRVDDHGDVGDVTHRADEY